MTIPFDYIFIILLVDQAYMVYPLTFIVKFSKKRGNTVGNTHINASASFGLVYWPQGPITIYRRGIAKKIGPTL